MGGLRGDFSCRATPVPIAPQAPSLDAHALVSHWLPPMVAAAQQTIAKGKPGRRSSEIPVFVRLKARNLYVAQGLSHPAIAEQTGLRVVTVRRLASREGWTGLRKRQKAQLLASADANAQAMQSDVLDAIASVSEQHAMRSLDRVGEALERTDKEAARDAQSYSGCLRNLVNVSREIRRPEIAAIEGAHLNVFVLRVGDQAKPAHPALEATCTEVCSGSGDAQKLMENAPGLNNANTVKQ